MLNPYATLTDPHFWKLAVHAAGDGVHPTVQNTFRISAGQKVATAGSCFAQHLGRHLQSSPSVDFLAAETLQAGDPAFSGRYGNIYTPHQLLQLFEECENGTTDETCAICRRDGRWVDIHRPFIEKDGFSSAEEVLDARRSHLKAIRDVFRNAEVFVFTLGLTEAWRATATGRVLPACPGIYSDDPTGDSEFVNFGFSDVKAAMVAFQTAISAVNPEIRLLLTVSPVPLTATYTEDHVLVATMHSKAILRAVCSEMAAEFGNVFYFPSYDLVANPYTGFSAFAPENLRDVKPEVVQRVMDIFDATYLGAEDPSGASGPEKPKRSGSSNPEDDDLFCDDVEIEKSIGF